ncbi:hypothetical protein HRbin27_01983 [bacterium HR27]|nr:hypothetical protein HRbin27_01983 [bacterium HR27]
MDPLRLLGGDPCEHRPHVGIVRTDRFLSDHRATELLDVFREDIGELLGIEAPVVDGGDSLEAELLDDELGRDLPLHLIVMGDAEIALNVLCWISEVGSGVGWRDHHEASLIDDRCADPCFRRAGRSDDRNDAWVGRKTGRRGLTALGVATRVFTDEFDLVTEELTAEILDRNLDASLRVLTELCCTTGDREHPGEDDRLTWLDLEHTDRVSRLRRLCLRSRLRS